MKAHLQVVAWSVVVLLATTAASAYDYGYDPAKEQGGSGAYMELAHDPTLVTSGVYAGKYEYFFDLYCTGGTSYIGYDIVGLDNSKIANAQHTSPEGGAFKTQEWGQPDGWHRRDEWSDSTGRVMDLWSRSINASAASAGRDDFWLSSYDDGAGGWTGAGLPYAWAGADNPHSYGEYGSHSSAFDGFWKGELTGVGQPYQWWYTQFGVVPTEDTVFICNASLAYADPWPSDLGLVMTLRVVYDEAIDPLTIGWSAGGASKDHLVLGDFTMYVPPMPGDFNDDDLVNTTDIDLLRDAIAAGSTDLMFDVNGDTVIDELDLIQHIATLVERTDSGVGTYRGDFNLDGYVDATDLAILKAGFGLTGLGYAAGNCNADTFVDGTDLAIFKATFGFSGTPGGLNPPAVPEPATMALLSLGAAALLRRRK